MNKITIYNFWAGVSVISANVFFAADEVTSGFIWLGLAILYAILDIIEKLKDKSPR